MSLTQGPEIQGKHNTTDVKGICHKMRLLRKLTCLCALVKVSRSWSREGRVITNSKNLSFWDFVRECSSLCSPYSTLSDIIGGGKPRVTQTSTNVEKGNKTLARSNASMLPHPLYSIQKKKATLMCLFKQRG